MGRGRAKAKQTKVARQLKYSSGGTDLDRLQEELAAERGSSYSTSTPASSTSEDSDDDEYAPDED
jgi:hypothetical protein